MEAPGIGEWGDKNNSLQTKELVPLPTRAGFKYWITPLKGGFLIEVWAQSGEDGNTGTPLFKYKYGYIYPSNKIVDKSEAAAGAGVLP